MSLDQFANLAEVLGMIMVIISLIYLNIQVRQNTIMLRSSATQGATDQIVEMYNGLILDESMTEVFMRGLSEPDTLSETETGRFFAWWMQALFVVQNWFIQTREGLIDPTLLDSFGKLGSEMGSSPGLQIFWESRKYAFDPEFVLFLDEQVFAVKKSGEYRPLSTNRS